MAPYDEPMFDPPPRTSIVVAIFIGAFAVRALAYAGFALGDDTIYLDAVLRAAHGAWPPAPTHWDTRLAMTLPAAGLIRVLGFMPPLLIAVPFVASLAKVVAIYLFAKRYLDARTAVLAGVLAAVYPGDVIYATHLFPDAAVGACTSIALLTFMAALLDRSPRLSFFAGAWLAAGYLARETIVLDAPLFLLLTLLLPGPRRWAVAAWALVLPAVTVAFETGLYALTAGDALYRVHAVLRQQADPDNLLLIATPTAGGTFWTDPLLMLVTSHEFGLLMILGMGVACLALRQADRIPRLLAAWLLVGWVWTSFGTTSPSAWVVLQRDARYYLELAAPVVLLLAWVIRPWARSTQMAVVALLVGTSLAAVSMEQGGTVVTAHRAVLARSLRQEVAFDAQEYVGARWVSGLLAPVEFAQLAEAPGRRWDSLPGHRLVSLRDPRLHTVVLGRLTKPDVVDQVRAAGFTLEDTVHARVPLARQLIGAALEAVPSQRTRAARAIAGRPLWIFTRP